MQDNDKLSDIMDTLSVMKFDFSKINKRLGQLTPVKSNVEQTPIGQKAFDRAMDNLDIDTEDISSLPKRNPRRSTIYEHEVSGTIRQRIKYTDTLQSSSMGSITYTSHCISCP